MSAARARLCVLAAAVLFGTTGTTQALIPKPAAPAVLGAARVVAGALGLLALAAAGGVRRPSRWPRAPLLVSGLGVAAYQVCFFEGVRRAGVALGTVVALGSAPAVTGALSAFVDRRPPTPAWLCATGLSVAGVALLVLPGAAARPDTAGVALALGAGVSYSAFTLATRRLLDAGVPAAWATAGAFATGALALSPLLARADGRWVTSAGGLAAVLWLGLAATTLAYRLFARGLAVLAPATVATLTLAEPVTAALLGVVVLGERPGAVGAAGAALVAAGLVLLSMVTVEGRPAGRGRGARPPRL